MIRNQSQETGATPSVQQLANHFQKMAKDCESIRNKDKNKRNNSNTSNESTRDNGTEPSNAERQSPVVHVPKKPVIKKRVGLTLGSYKGSNADKKQSSPLLPKMASVSSDYENPDDIEQLQAPTPDHSDKPIYANTKESREISKTIGDFKSNASTDINKTESGGFVLDLSTCIPIPPPKPCKSDSGDGYINALKQCSPSEDDDVFVEVPGYVNIPIVSKDLKVTNKNKDVDEGNEYENVTKESNELCEDKEYANITKQKAPKSLPPPTCCNPIYANIQKNIQKRGNRGLAFRRKNIMELAGALVMVPVDMGEHQEEDDEYVVMGKLDDNLDMNGVSDNGVNTSSAVITDANDHSHEYVNTLSDGNDEIYAVPSVNLYKTVGGKARPVIPENQYKTVIGEPRCTTQRSRNTDYIYDYAYIDSVINFKE